MKNRFLLTAFLFATLCLGEVKAQTRYIVRVAGGLPVMQTVCSLLSCNIVNNLDGILGQVFVVTTADGVDPSGFLASLTSATGIINAEIDQIAATSQSGASVPPALTDRTPVSFFGSTVINGYIHQPATALVHLEEAQNRFNTGDGKVVAVIDTGVDPNHAVLKDVLLPGYDAIGNTPFADETLSLPLNSTPSGDVPNPVWTNGRSAALVDQSTAAVIDGDSRFSAFGHGTMVAGVVHLAAPRVRILPIRAFLPDGSGYNSDIIRAVYYAASQNATVINMSFHLPAYSQELRNAIAFAGLSGTVSVAAAGNGGNDVPLYPASYPEVISVASTSNADQLSSFSSYGNRIWLAAPGEGVVTTYPFGTYAAAWGTSFSAPFVSGAAALLQSNLLLLNQSQSADALAHADRVNAPVGNGRLNVATALGAGRSSILFR